MPRARHSISFAAAVLAIAVLAIALPSVGAQSEAYPHKPITFIVPFAAGGGTDAIARILQDDIRKELGQPIIIDNRPGANGAIGTGFAARAVPDGYTLLLTASSTFSLNPNLMKNIQYDQLNDFIPVASVIRAPWMLVVNDKSGFKTVADIVKAAKERPDALSVGYWQSNVLITSEIFQRAADVQLLKVPYKSVVEAVSDLLGQRIDMLFVDIQAVSAHIESGALRYVAATTAERVSVAPGIPTLAESGYPSVVTDASVVLFAPAKTPAAIVERLNEAMVKVVSTSDVARQKLRAIGHEPTTMALAQVDGFVRSELSRWGEMIKSVGLQKE
jgi:tripartite-type tricarboxylate transporter receptor subunit TctC